jgi:hypothetical protein
MLKGRSRSHCTVPDRVQMFKPLITSFLSNVDFDFGNGIQFEKGFLKFVKKK